MNPPLSQLLERVDCLSVRGAQDAGVSCLITDSRRVVPGALFFAIQGERTDGNQFIEEAVDRGAVAVVSESDLGIHFPIPFVQVANVRMALATVAKDFYGAPDEALQLTGITGTNGKTTVAMLAQHLLGGNEAVGLIGTVRYDLGRRTLPAFRTTPESVDSFAMLSQMVANGCRSAVMEISSHGIDQKRAQGIAVDVAAFLNLTQDHIDYHESMEAYYAAKRCLFTGETGSVAGIQVIGIDDPYGRRLIEERAGNGSRTISFGFSEEADFRAEGVELRVDGSAFDVVWPEGREHVEIPLPGRYNILNALAALAICAGHGREVTDVLPRLKNFPGVPGRMERIDEGQPYSILVDYAHTDDALSHALAMLREITKGRTIIVFGCGGSRDRGKRAVMLDAALRGADEVFVTADNPRTEPLERIFEDMRAAEGSQRARFIDDRRSAISAALDLAQPGDCVLVAGKGHETYQEFDGTIIPFDDREVVRELLTLKNQNA